jgi:hypothetical protein
MGDVQCHQRLSIALGALRQINRLGLLAPEKNGCRRRLQAMPLALDLSPLGLRKLS